MAGRNTFDWVRERPKSGGHVQGEEERDMTGAFVRPLGGETQDLTPTTGQRIDRVSVAVTAFESRRRPTCWVKVIEANVCSRKYRSRNARAFWSQSSHAASLLGRRMRNIIAAIGLLAISDVPGTSAAHDAAIAVDVNAAAALALLPVDHPEGTNAAVKLVSIKRATNVHELTLSTFIIDYQPDGSAVLDRSPSSWYMLVHAFSGYIW